MRLPIAHSRWFPTMVMLVAALAATALLSGCASTSQTDATDPLPWNQPAGWENTTIGIPF